MKTRVLSCIQPTGVVHLGNLLGAILPWVASQHSSSAYHGIVDLHALTVEQDPFELRRAVHRTAAALFASGIDPELATVFVQGRIPAHSQLAWILQCVCSFGELNRMTQFKEKAGGERDYATSGLFTYPVLMAADILLYDAAEVPVGEDQRQHLELARNLAERFNSKYGSTFVVPKGIQPLAAARVMSLQDPLKKMSKTHGASGVVQIDDDDTVIRDKFRRAVTDSGREVRYDREFKPGISNLIEIYAALSDLTIPNAVTDLQSLSYLELKETVGDRCVDVISPIRERYLELINSPSKLESLLSNGTDVAKVVADRTLTRALEAVGVG